MTLPLRLSAPVLCAIALGMVAACSPGSEPGDEPAADSEGAAARQPGIGELKATIGDVAYRGETVDSAAHGSSTAEFRDLGAVKSVKIQAHDPAADGFMHNVLAVEFTLAGSDPSAPVTGTTISYWPGGTDGPFYHSEGSASAPQVVLDAVSFEQGAASASGRYSANLCRKADFFAEPNRNDCVAVEGTFDTALRKSA
ncbi:MAG: hypothetical protein VX569_07485 [Pseudomonadota bacterium]|nr:hypothetical protein [Pseudomonadota bacterium]